jgi:hypothetical protein
MSRSVICNSVKLLLLVLCTAFLLLHPPAAFAIPCCSDCPQVLRVGQPPDCPAGSACYGCWTTCSSQCGGGTDTCSTWICYNYIDGWGCQGDWVILEYLCPPW